MGLKFLKINPADNVAVAIDPLKKGDCITVDGKDIFLQEDIPAGHKVALKDFAENEDIIKYGYAIGHARCAIIKGAWVNERNIKTNLEGLLEYSYSPNLAELNIPNRNLSFMGSTVKNKVLKLTNTAPEIIKGNYSIKEGMPINTFYMAKSAGVDPATGSQLYWVYDKDENGNIINERISDDYSKASTSKYYQGNRIPDLYGSIGTDFSYKGIDLSILTTYSIGGKIYDGLYTGSMNAQYATNTWNKHQLRRWQQPGDVTDVPRVEINGSYATTDRFLINASYFAIKNITLGYSLPKDWMRKAKLNNIRVFGSIDNLALFSHLQGMDPQYNFKGETDYSYAPNKTYSFGVEINF